MSLVCPDCRFENPPRANFCAGCGKVLHAPGTAPLREAVQAQRRQVTVLFADLVGSTALATQLDPEDLHALIRRYQRVCAEVVTRYGGHVAQYLGDGVLAYFGYPRAHEDDAARATRAGLEIAGRLAAGPLSPAHPQVSARVGIATGTVVVDEHPRPGTGSRQEVVGETPNLAARLQNEARPDTVVVAEATRRLLGGQFKYEDLGAVQLKGFSTPVRAFRVIAPADTRIRFDATRGRRIPPLVGRESELQWLKARWQEAMGGHGQVVLVSGPPGIGKSRLCKALFAELSDTTSYTPIRIQCSPYHTSSPLYPFIAHLERVSGIQPTDTPEQKLHKLGTLLDRSTEAPEQALPLIASLLAIPVADDSAIQDLTPAQRRERTLAALVDQLEALTAYRPVCVHVEDTQWADPTSTELLQACMNRCIDLPILMLVTHRPDNPFPAPELPHIHQLPLRRLRMDESRRLARHVAASQDLEPAVLDQIALKTDGIPLFVEEVTRSVLHATAGCKRSAQSTCSLPVPASLKDALTERLDHLGPAREVAQLCAVIGREIPHSLLHLVSPLDEKALEHALQRLVESEILFRSRRQRRSWGDFIFKHALVRDTAYESLLISQRRSLHLKVARAIEVHFPEHVQRQPELLATHYGAGGDHAKAATYWGRAALDAFARSANSEVILHVEQALEQLRHLPPSSQRLEQELRFQVLLGGAQRAAVGFASPEMKQAFQAARALCEQIGEPATPVLIDVLRGLYSFHYARGELGLARELARQVLALAERGDPASRAVGLYMLGGMQFWQGEFATAEQTLQDAWAAYDPSTVRQGSLSTQTDPGAFALFQLAWTQWMLGRPERALATANQALAHSRGLKQPFTHAVTLFWAGVTHLCCGRVQEAAALAREALDLTTSHKLRYLRAYALVLQGHVLIDSGQTEAGLQRVDQAMADFAAQGAGLGTAWALSKPIEVHIREGRYEQARNLITTARAAIARNDELHWVAEIERLAGELALCTNPPKARARFERALTLARELGATALELRAATSLVAVTDPPAEEERKQLAAVLSRIEGSVTTPDTDAARLMLSEAQPALPWQGRAGHIH